MKVEEKRGPLTGEERGDHALAETYGRGSSIDSRNRRSQLLLALALVATVVGVFLLGTPVGIASLAIGLPTLVGTAVWCVRNWDY